MNAVRDRAQFIRDNTELIAPPLVPEIRLHLATEIVPLWRKTEEEVEAEGIPPPFWAFAWAGGQALARYLLDHPQQIANRSVLEVGSGSGLVAIAAAKTGATHVLASDIDPFALAAMDLNAAANAVQIEMTTDDLIGREGNWDVILVADMCYERPLAERLLDWLTERRRNGATVLIGDPRRSYFPQASVEELAIYNVQTTRELEDQEIRATGVYALTA